MSFKKRNVKKIGLIAGLIVVLIFICISTYIRNNLLNKKSSSDLINISKLSKEFMSDYFNEIEELNKSGDTDNILIAISSKEIMNSYGAKKVIAAPNNQYILKYANENAKNKALTELKKENGVISVEESVKYSFSEIPGTSQEDYNSWGIQKMGFDKAINSLDAEKLEDVTVAILDSGCNMDLFNKYYNGKIVETYNVIDNNNSVYDKSGHGTHIAGTIAEGTSSNVKIIPVQNAVTSTISDFNIITGINWIVYNNKADIINMSFGGDYYSYAMYQAIESAKEEKIICVAAAGNYNVASLFYPAAFENTISIASVDNKLDKSSFSNYGSTITFTAPGTDIKSIMSDDTLISENNAVVFGSDGDSEHETIGGTSMATPHAVNAVALLKSFNKDLTLNNVIELLKEHSIDLGEDGWDNIFGYGFIDFSNAEFCDGTNCDDYNVFKNSNSSSNIVKIDAGADIYESLYNYGNNTNIMNIKLKIYYNEFDYIEKDLGELKNVIIENYNPDLEGEQNITIKYKGYEVNKKVMNYLTTGWNFGEFYDDGIIYSFNYSEEYPKYIEIPEFLNGKKVTILDSRLFANKEKIKKVFLPQSIKKIGDGAFFKCKNLNYVNIPDGVETIVRNTFYGTSSLSSINLPSSIKKIEEGAFDSGGLYSVEVPGSIQKIEKNSFSNMSSLNSVIINDGVEEISSFAFENTKMTKIRIPKTVKKIDDNPFKGCGRLNEIIIDNENEFYESKIDSVTIVEKENKALITANNNSIIPEDVKILNSYSINGIDAGNGYKIPNGIKEIKNYAFNINYGFIVLPKSITAIESKLAFYSGEGLNYSTLWVYKNSYVSNFAIDNDLNYNFIEPENIEVQLQNNSYQAFDKVSKDDLLIKVYNGGSSTVENTIDDYEIVYNNGKDLRYGDSYFTVEFDSIIGSYVLPPEELTGGPNNINFIKGEHVEKEVSVNVVKATPSYVIPTNIKADFGKKLSEIKLPDGFEWMNGNKVVDIEGKYKAKFIPDDLDNYNEIENIEIDVSVINCKTIITPSISIDDKVYDGTTSINNNSISISNLNSSDYTIVSAELLSASAGDTTAKVKIKLTNEKFKESVLNGLVQEKEYTVNVKIKPEKLKKPSLISKTYIYNGENQEVNVNDYNSSKMTIKGNIRKNAGSQDITISLKNSNYVWEDNSTNDVILTFMIEKADSNIVYTAKDKSVMYDGELYGINLNIKSPDNAKVKYMDINGEYTLDEMPKYSELGNYVIKYKIYINDNYKSVIGEKTLSIVDEIINNSRDYEGIYDGNDHSINFDLNVDECDIKYSVNVTNYDLDKLPKFKNVGEYTVNYKISCSNSEDLFGSNKVKIYGIKDMSSSMLIKNNLLLIRDNNFSKVKAGIETYPSSSEIKHYDKNKVLNNLDLIKTGESIEIVFGVSHKLVYFISVLGDPSCDGKISSFDYVIIKKHIMNTDKINNTMISMAADANRDGKITSFDYIKIKKYIMNGDQL